MRWIMWIKTNEKLPSNENLVIAAYLERYENARWSWRLQVVRYRKMYDNWDGTDGYGAAWPQYWTPFPEPPNMTPKEKEKSEEAYQKGRDERIKNAKKKLEEAMSE